MLFSCIVILWISYFLSVTRSPYEISCFLALMRFYVISKWDLMLLWPLWDFLMGFHQHALHQVDTYVWGWRNVTWTCSCDWRRFSRGLGLWSDVCYLKNVCLLWAVTILWSGFCALFLKFILSKTGYTRTCVKWLENTINSPENLVFSLTVIYAHFYTIETGDIHNWGVGILQT